MTTPSRPHFIASIEFIEDIMKLPHAKMEIVGVTYDYEARTVCFEIGGTAAEEAVALSGEPAPRLKLQYIKDGNRVEPALALIHSIYPKA